jgi:hypothetical protein
MIHLLGSAQGELKFEKKVLKLKPANEGAKVAMEFVATNVGNAPVSFFNYEVECHCTKVILPNTSINPGEKVILPVEFDTEGKIGWQYRTVIYFTDSTQGKETVEFRIKVKN